MSGEPFSDTTNPALKASVMGLIDSVDTMILGANTYARAKDYWPYAEEQGVCPVSRGKGTRIFQDRQDLKLVEATGFENGVALLRYEINK